MKRWMLVLFVAALPVQAADNAVERGLNTAGKAVERLKHFVSRDAFDIEGLGEKQITAFWQDKLVHGPGDIFRLKAHEAALKHREGWGEKSVDNLPAALESRRTVPLARYVYALGIRQVGQATARRARGFGLTVHYHNRRRVHPDLEAELEATYWESLDQMLSRVDIVSVNCPRTPATFHLLSRRRLELLKPHAYIVNTSRGEVIDEATMSELIEAGKIAGAGLDVFEHEPAVDPRLMKSERVMLLPHISSSTIEGRQEMGERVIINIRAFVDGHTPPDRVLDTMF